MYSEYYQVEMSFAQPPKLLDQIRNLIRLRHMSHKTERAYISYARDYYYFTKSAIHVRWEPVRFASI